MKKTWVATTLLLLCFGFGNAQSTLSVIEGRIVDHDTKQGVPFANIALLRSGTGTSSNESGAFALKIRNAAEDTLVISSVGYATEHIPVKEWKRGAVLYLRQAAVELPSLDVKSKSGLEMLEEAIARIRENYDTSPVGYTAFYQENVWLGDVELSFIEAIAKINRSFSAGRVPNDKISIVKGRKKELDYSRDPQLYYWLNGTSNGLRGGLTEDLIKYRNNKYSPLNPRNFKHYQYEHVETIYDGDTRLIVLDIFPRSESKKAILRMRLFLDEATMAIARYTFELTESGLKRTSRKDKHIGYAIMSKVVHATLDYHRFQYTFTYRQHHGKWYLNRINRHWETHVDSKRRGWEDRLWTHDMNLFITEIDTTPELILEGNIGNSETPLVLTIGEDFHNEFWGNYNFIKSEEAVPAADTLVSSPGAGLQEKRISNRKNGFTRADTLRGRLTPLRDCYDVTFYHLDVEVDLHKHSIKGGNLIRFKVVKPFQRAQIDLHANMQIEHIIFQGQPLAYSREFNAVYITFPSILEVGTETSVEIFYYGIPKEPDFAIPMDGGALWETDSLGNVWAQMVCQGSGASVWWPNKDHLSDEPDSMKIWITVPSDYVDISNGTLTGITTLPGEKTRYEWSIHYPINNYNVTYNIGKYIHWSEEYRGADTVQLNFYTLAHHRSIAKPIFQAVPAMLRTFEGSFGTYPFPKDGFALVESIYPMEHQSGVCIGKLINPHPEVKRLMWHESAHEWWGNAISVADMADLWIHEAFATYAEMIMTENQYGEEYLGELIADQFNAIRGIEPIVGIYDVNHIHYDIEDMYSKGSLMLHTLRNIVNDDNKWKGILIAIQNEFRYKTVDTKEMVSFISNYLEADYTWFFEQYLFHKDLPMLEMRLEQRGNNVLLKHKWTAEVDPFPMPVRIMHEEEAGMWLYPTGQWQSVIIKDASVDDVEVDQENFLIDVHYSVSE